MEQSKYWLWSRTKLGGMPHLPSLAAANAATGASYDDSWEEQAFAEDSAAHLGGCVWPPRSYSCSFCRREFRSAQALGGHMNVHRRDRARLRLSSPTNHIESGRLHHLQQHQPPNPCNTPLAAQYPLVYTNSPNPSVNPAGAAVPPPLSPSRVSVASNHENCSDHTLVSPSYSSPLVKEDVKTPLFSISRSHSDPFSLRILTVPELKLGAGSQKLMDMDYGKKRDGCFEEEDAIGTKRRRIDVTIPFPCVGSSPGEGSPPQSEVLGLVPPPIEELDLELRLGDRPKIK